jgi:hypothetical protein
LKRRAVPSNPPSPKPPTSNEPRRNRGDSLKVQPRPHSRAVQPTSISCLWSSHGGLCSPPAALGSFAPPLSQPTSPALDCPDPLLSPRFARPVLHTSNPPPSRPAPTSTPLHLCTSTQLHLSAPLPAAHRRQWTPASSDGSRTTLPPRLIFARPSPALARLQLPRNISPTILAAESVTPHPAATRNPSIPGPLHPPVQSASPARLPISTITTTAHSPPTILPCLF